jgi:peptidylprolyl isomerase
MRYLKRAAALALLLAVAVGGCGGSSSSDTEPSPQRVEPFRIPQTMPPVRRQENVTGGGERLMGPELQPVIPDQAPPRTLVLQDLIQGLGFIAEAGDEVSIQYVEYDYDTGEKLFSSWDRGRPSTVVLGSGTMDEGVEEGLVDMQVGDRREMIVPSALGESSKQPDGPAGQTHDVYVVDLLAIQ